jgi:NAD(P)-dependent dehydrogenase (short-subunit alcohol dehydrogenase family)
MSPRVLFVTGGSRGVGAGIVLGAVGAGLDVAFTYRSRRDAADDVIRRAREIAPERKVRAYELDVRDPADLERVGDAVMDEFDRVDVVVANAGITSVGLAVSTMDADWANVIQTNLTGAFYTARQFLPTFLARRHGRLIFVSSVAANGMSGDVAYCASKAGLIGMAKSLAKEYGRKGITSNALVLGLFETDMTKTDLSDDRRGFFMQYCPAGRVGQTSEVAAAVLYLASEAASFVNGQTLSLTGGLDWFQ